MQSFHFKRPLWRRDYGSVGILMLYTILLIVTIMVFINKFQAMLQSKNYTISADATTSLRPIIEEKIKQEEEEPSSSKPKKIPRQIDPKVNNVVTLDEITRNKKKHRYRIIIGKKNKK